MGKHRAGKGAERDEPRPSFRARQEHWIRQHPWLSSLILATVMFGTTFATERGVTDTRTALVMAGGIAMSFFVLGVVMAKFVRRRTRDRLD